MQVILIDENAKEPKRGTSGAAGYDIYSIRKTVIKPNERVLIPTGIKIAFPDGCYGVLKSRSSMAMNNIDVKAGVIDCDYRGEVKVLLHNSGVHDYHINVGDRVCQMLIHKVIDCNVEVVTCLSATKRGEGGFGSTGL